MTRKVVSPIALDKSINTTEQTPRNIADVLAQQLAAIKTAIESGNGNLEAAFVCYYGVTTATQIKNAIEDGKVPYFYYNGVVAQLWKVETDKYTFRTTNTRSVEGQTILDVVDYVVNGSVWSTVTREVSGGSSSGQSYIASVNSLADFDTTGKSGMQDLISVANVPADGVYQVSVMLHITPKTASATKSDLVLQFTSSDNTGWPSHTFHAVVDDSQTFAQQLSFSTSVSLKAGQNTLRIQCGDLNTEYLAFVDELTVAQLVNGVYHNGDDFADAHTLPEAPGLNNDDGFLVDGLMGGPRFMPWSTLANILAAMFAIVEQLLNVSSPGRMFAITDADGRVLFDIDSSGNFIGENVKTHLVEFLTEFIPNFFKTAESQNAFAVVDSSNKILFSIDKFGRLSIDDQVRDDILEFFNRRVFGQVFSIVDSSGTIVFSIDENGRLSIDDQVHEDIDSHFLSETGMAFAIVDKDKKLLLGVDKEGVLHSTPIEDFVDEKLSSLDTMDYSYVDEKVLDEKTRAETAEQDLAEAIENINPTQVVGGQNNPDEEFLTSINDKVTLKNINNLINGMKIVYIRKLDNPLDVITNENTCYIITFNHSLSNETLEFPEGCALIFKGGCLYDGTINGNETFIYSYTENCFGTSLDFSGSFVMPLIKSSYFMGRGNANEFKKISTLLSDDVFNKIIFEPGNYYFLPVSDNDKLVTLKSNTEVIVDGNIETETNRFPHNYIFYANQKKNIFVHGAGKLSGDTDTHDYSTITSSHEWCHGFEFVATDAVEINGLYIEKFPGDAIEAAGNNQKFSNLKIDHCGRQGISILTAGNVVVENCIISNIYRTPPKAAIDIEPYTDVHAENISIKNVMFENCMGLDLCWCDRVIVENIRFKGSKFLLLKDVTNIVINNVFGENITMGQNTILSEGVVKNVILDNLIFDTQSLLYVQLNGVKIGTNCNFGSNAVISSGPAIGSQRVQGGQFYQFFNGTSWQDF